MQTGDLVICNDVMGFIVEIKALTFVLNTSSGLKELALSANPVVMSTAQEIAQAYANQIKKAVCNR